MTTALFDRFVALKSETPHLFARDAAARLGCSEAEIVAAMPSSLRLAPRFAEIFRGLPQLGEVKTITRNEHAVIEKWGAFESVEIGAGPLGQVVGDEIDLRLFLRQFRHVFFVDEETARGRRESLQLFDEHGDSIHKIYAETADGARAMRLLAAEHLAEQPGGALVVSPRPPRASAEGLAAGDVEPFRRAWDGMTNTHDFFGILRRFMVGRVQALEAAGPSRAVEVERGALATILGWAAESQAPIMVFVGSRGVLQIHTGPVRAVRPQQGWINVLDRRFNLHVKESAVARAFVVRKPTDDGVVSSLELFDERDETIALLFSKRKPGQIEGEPWRAILASLPAPEVS